MSQVAIGGLYCVAFFFGMLALLKVGLAVGTKARAVDPEVSGTGAVESAVFALLGLLIAFTFSGAAARFDNRRTLIGQEVNAIGTAWLRIDLVPEAARPRLRSLFKDYVDARIEGYARYSTDPKAGFAALDRATAIQGDIWTASVEGVRAPDAVPGASVLLLGALNEMFDITTTRLLATREHPPGAIYALLFVLGLAAAFFAGFGMAGKKVFPLLHAVGFAAIIALTVYLSIDLEYPRQGFVRVDDFDVALVELRATLKP
jgi:hypothetical protein